MSPPFNQILPGQILPTKQDTLVLIFCWLWFVLMICYCSKGNKYRVTELVHKKGTNWQSELNKLIVQCINAHKYVCVGCDHSANTIFSIHDGWILFSVSKLALGGLLFQVRIMKICDAIKENEVWESTYTDLCPITYQLSSSLCKVS